MLLEYSISAAVAAFIIMVAFIIYTLIEVRLAIQQSRQMLTRMELKLEHTAEETLGLVRNAQRLLTDIDNHVKASDGFIKALVTTGQSAKLLSQSVNGFSCALAEIVTEAQTTLQSQQDTVREIINLSTTGIQLWKKWQSRKPSRTASNTDEH